MLRQKAPTVFHSLKVAVSGRGEYIENTLPPPGGISADGFQGININREPGKGNVETRENMKKEGREKIKGNLKLKGKINAKGEKIKVKNVPKR
jgi:hypothetical protein